MSERAQELNERGNILRGEGRIEEAEAAFRAAIELAPEWSAPWYNLGLLYKYEGRWEDSLQANRRAVQLAPEDGDAWWNLGIAATALGDWEAAREAWTGCGVEVPAGDGPIEGMRLGPVPIRLQPDSRGEVVWCDRIDPARAIVLNVPLPESGHRWRDLVLHDGAPNGYRRLGDQDVPVFDQLAILRKSEYLTFELDLAGTSHEARERLTEIADALGGAAEDWSRSIRYLCRQCSEGAPHQEHDTALAGERPALGFGAAARDEDHLREILRAWGGEAAWKRVR